MRQVAPKEPTGGRPVLFVHGAILASYFFDVALEEYSWMEHIARKGCPVFALDIRGYGASDKPPAMDDAPGNSPPIAGSAEALQDIDDAVEFIRGVAGCEQIDLVGASWGSLTCGIYASGPGGEKIHKLVLVTPVFATRNEDWLDRLADPVNPKQLNPDLGAYRWVTEDDIRLSWDAQIPVTDKTEWRAEQCFRAIIDEALKWDLESSSRSPAAFQSPNGTWVDLFEVFSGRPLYEPEKIEVPTLLIRGAEDPTATDPDARALFERLGAQIKRYVVIGHGTHFLAAEKNRWQLFSETWNFLKPSQDGN